ncbi:hypothetical protein O9929_01605 [Vibrio lentus]|nr:hypothetical protein [Vibrio lentus]
MVDSLRATSWFKDDAVGSDSRAIERSCEHVKTLENPAAQGFIRARIDGETCDLSDPPTLNCTRNTPLKLSLIALRSAQTFNSV